MYKVFLFMFLKHAQRITQATAWRCFMGTLLRKHLVLKLITGIKADYISVDKLFHSIFREIFQSNKPSFFLIPDIFWQSAIIICFSKILVLYKSQYMVEF